jgi:uncharacterized protein (PEP-CTERM system associated)
MATTASTGTERAARGQSRALALAQIAASVAAAVAWPGAAQAQRWTVDAGVSTQVTVTDNSGFEDTQTQTRSDGVVEVAPRVTFRREGARLRAAGSLALGALHYVEGTRESRLVPAANLGATLEAVPRNFFIDAAAVVTQTRANPFAPQPEGLTSVNRLQETQVRVSPYLQGNPSANTRVFVRSDNSLTRGTREGVTEIDSYVGRHVAEFERLPRPLGLGLQLERTETRFRDTAQGPLTLDIARLRLTYGLGAQFTAGLRYGYETNNYVIDGGDGRIWGAEFTWRPTERTDLNGVWEHRFFGSGTRLSFSHRLPRLAWNLLVSRDVGSAPQSLFTLPATDNVAGLLDAALTTRFPDPVERARVVQELMARQGLPGALGSPLPLYAQRVSLLTSKSASIVLLGARGSIGLTGFYLRTEDLRDSIFAPSDDTLNNSQRGAALTFSRELSPVTSLNATLGWTHAQGLTQADPEESDQYTLRVQALRRIGPRTQAYVGARRQVFNSTRVGDAREAAAFAGLAHRF